MSDGRCEKSGQVRRRADEVCLLVCKKQRAFEPCKGKDAVHFFLGTTLQQALLLNLA
jgi:hypothetical protein